MLAAYVVIEASLIHEVKSLLLLAMNVVISYFASAQMAGL
jgi:hypothetical protein